MSILARFTLALLANALCERIRPTIYRDVQVGSFWAGAVCVHIYRAKKRRPWEAS